MHLSNSFLDNYIRDLGNAAIAYSLEKNIGLLFLDISGTKINSDIKLNIEANLRRNLLRKRILLEAPRVVETARFLLAFKPPKESLKELALPQSLDGQNQQQETLTNNQHAQSRDEESVDSY